MGVSSENHAIARVRTTVEGHHGTYLELYIFTYYSKWATRSPYQAWTGVAAGDPFSLMLFILAMDPLQRLLDMATQEGLLHPIGADPVKLRTNLYADDVVLFIRPIPADVAKLQQLHQHFGTAIGLCTNIHKSEIIPI
jgi:hypothetical protein